MSMKTETLFHQSSTGGQQHTLTGFFALKKIVRSHKRRVAQTKPIPLRDIEKIVPPSNLVMFFSSLLVSVPTTVQLIKSYAGKTWGKDEVTTTRVMCSLAVAFKSATAKRAGVVWAKQVLDAEYELLSSRDRLVKSWDKAVLQAESSELITLKREQKESFMESEKAAKLEVKLEETYRCGREEEENRLQNLRRFIKDYPDLLTDERFRKRTVDDIIDGGLQRENVADIQEKIKLGKITAMLFKNTAPKKYVPTSVFEVGNGNDVEPLSKDEKEQLKKAMEKIHATIAAKQREREEETQLPCAVNDVLPKKPTRPEGQKTDFRAHTFPKRATSYITKSSSVVELARSWEEGKNADVQTAVTP